MRLSLMTHRPPQHQPPAGEGGCASEVAREGAYLVHEGGDREDVPGEGGAVGVGGLDEVEKARVVEEQLGEHLYGPRGPRGGERGVGGAMERERKGEGVRTCLRISCPRWKLANDWSTSLLIDSIPPFHVSKKLRQQVLHPSDIDTRRVRPPAAARHQYTVTAPSVKQVRAGREGRYVRVGMSGQHKCPRDLRRVARQARALPPPRALITTSRTRQLGVAWPWGCHGGVIRVQSPPPRVRLARRGWM